MTMYDTEQYNTENAIEVKGLCKSFDKIVALKDASTVIQKGSIFGLIGSNGAGKSTFLRLLAGIYVALDLGTCIGHTVAEGFDVNVFDINEIGQPIHRKIHISLSPFNQN